MTLSTDYILDSINIENKTIQLKIYYTPGIERLRAISLSTVIDSHGIILLFSVDNRKSFESLNYWIESIDKIKNTNPVIYLVGNNIWVKEKSKKKKEWNMRKKND